MRKNIIYSLLLALTALGFASCSSDSDNDPVTSPDEVLTPIRISAAYNGSSRSTTRVAYAEDGDNISATWQAGDQLYVCYNGHVNTLALSDGAGTATATFDGTIQGTPTSNSILICYVRDANSPSAVSVNNNGEYTYASGTFTSQDGTLAGAAKCNLYYGTTTYGTGEDISCTFSVNTSMLKFTVYAPDGVNEGDAATLTYKSDGTALAAASFTVGSGGRNTIYMTVPAGQYTGEQTLQYVSGSADQCETLSATKATFAAGQTYSKTVLFGSGVVFEANSSNFASQVAVFNAEETPHPILRLTGNVTSSKVVITRANGTIDLNGHTLDFGSDWLWLQNNVKGESITIMNGTLGSRLDGSSTANESFYGTVIFQDLTFRGEIFTDGHKYEMINVNYEYITSPTISRLENYGNGDSSYPNEVIIRSGKYNCRFYDNGDTWPKGITYIYGGKFALNVGSISNIVVPSGYSVKSNTDDDAATYPYIVSAD